ncbi:hypothetical protein PVAP13_9KG026471 [Panicum virgatum]|uniref:Uncharacterized protein n=1 Tax=Panicum virgatum TaxID=38727 RepID=A0A8T0N985_PANVG|nr:hypothetical protein PVAP13_9KG026471 [Panicum virgatum]
MRPARRMGAPARRGFAALPTWKSKNRAYSSDKRDMARVAAARTEPERAQEPGGSDCTSEGTTEAAASRSSRRRRHDHPGSLPQQPASGSASTEQTEARRKPAPFGPRADQEAPQGTSGSSRTGKENARMHENVEGTIAGVAGLETLTPMAR